jgi:hypothetical protein
LWRIYTSPLEPDALRGWSYGVRGCWNVQVLCICGRISPEVHVAGLERALRRLDDRSIHPVAVRAGDGREKSHAASAYVDSSGQKRRIVIASSQSRQRLQSEKASTYRSRCVHGAFGMTAEEALAGATEIPPCSRSFAAAAIAAIHAPDFARSYGGPREARHRSAPAFQEPRTAAETPRGPAYTDDAGDVVQRRLDAKVEGGFK